MASGMHRSTRTDILGAGLGFDPRPRHFLGAGPVGRFLIFSSGSDWALNAARAPGAYHCWNIFCCSNGIVATMLLQLLRLVRYAAVHPDLTQTGYDLGAGGK